MLNGIRSIFFIRKLFSNVNAKTKLKIIRYNKSLQKKIDISLINYKIFSGKYIIYENNGIGKEYNGHYDKLEFEGEYINGNRLNLVKNNLINDTNNLTVFGKEYYDGELIFEGEYLNGERNGKGKEYNNCELIFEGEYLNGKRNGKGKEYNNKGELIFEGEYLNDNRLDLVKNNLINDNNNVKVFGNEYNRKVNIKMEKE